MKYSLDKAVAIQPGQLSSQSKYDRQIAYL